MSSQRKQSSNSLKADVEVTISVHCTNLDQYFEQLICTSKLLVVSLALVLGLNQAINTISSAQLTTYAANECTSIPHYESRSQDSDSSTADPSTSHGNGNG